MEHLVIEIPAIIKAKTLEDGRRIVEVEASNESVDLEGDVILQQALLDAGPNFVKSGHLDIDHISEIGHRYGISNPSSFIVGTPLAVNDLGNGRTGVRGEIMRSKDGIVDAKAHKYDELWESLNSEPQVRWRASIYGFPTASGVIDCSKATSGVETYGATRWLVKSINWRSLAFTRNPINDEITGSARVVTEKAFFEIMKARIEKSDYEYNLSPPLASPIKYMLSPRNREEIIGHWHGHIQKGLCPCAGGDMGSSVFSFRNHFQTCCAEPEWTADVLALALMQLLKRERR
jgi:hypothetical protein